MSAIYYHNPKCSKSRAGLEILEKSQVCFTVKEYLQEEIGKDELKAILLALDIKPLDLMRKKETIFSELCIGEKEYSEDEYISFIQKNPILLERPILINGNKAVIGRPTENLQSFVSKLSISN